MSNGRIDVVLDPAVVSECVRLLTQIDEQLPFLMRLSPDEKIRLVKARPGAQEAMQGVAELQRHAGMPPRDDDPMLADLSVYAGLTTIVDCLASLHQCIDDTRLDAL